eukprot:13018426-Alexandrium_andersonii.AAC.1
MAAGHQALAAAGGTDAHSVTMTSAGAATTLSCQCSLPPPTSRCSICTPTLQVRPLHPWILHPTCQWTFRPLHPWILR